MDKLAALKSNVEHAALRSGYDAVITSAEVGSTITLTVALTLHKTEGIVEGADYGVAPPL